MQKMTREAIGGRSEAQPPALVRDLASVDAVWVVDCRAASPGLACLPLTWRCLANTCSILHVARGTQETSRECRAAVSVQLLRQPAGGPRHPKHAKVAATGSIRPADAHSVRNHHQAHLMQSRMPEDMARTHRESTHRGDSCLDQHRGEPTIRLAVQLSVIGLQV